MLISAIVPPPMRSTAWLATNQDCSLVRCFGETDMDFSQFVASGAPAIAEGAIVERVRRDPSLPFDPHILNGGLIYDPAGRERLAEIHNDYIRSARRSGLPILIGTDTWRCSQSLI